MADAANPPIKVFYASAVGKGLDPTFLSVRFYVYFIVGKVPTGENVWSKDGDGTLMREEVTIPAQYIKAAQSFDDE